MPKILLELFSGTGSVGKAAKKRGYKVISIDNEEKFKPTYIRNIATWDFKKDLPKHIDFIWASPPCVSFSILNNSMKKPHRDIKTNKPLDSVGRMGNKLLNQSLNIIKYYLSLNPKLKFVIENPRGYMRRMPQLKKYQLTTTSYSQYGFPYNKPTDFWSNFKLNLKPVDTRKNQNLEGAQGQSRETLYRIPQPLLTQIFKDAGKTQSKKNDLQEKINNFKDTNKKKDNKTEDKDINTFHNCR